MTGRAHHRFIASAAVAAALALAACGEQADPVAEQEAANREQASQVRVSPQDNRSAGAVETHPGTPQPAILAAAPAPTGSDERITAQVKSALAADRDLGGAKIDVHTEDGKVTLRGTAPDASARDQAADVARQVPQVKSVDNQLTLG